MRYAPCVLRATTMDTNLPHQRWLADPRSEHDACGVGFVCDIAGRRSHRLVRQALTVLARMAHRGARGADPDTGDGAGILLQIPHTFYAEVCEEAGIALPDEGRYGTGLVFLPPGREDRAACKRAVVHFVESEGQQLLGWRQVPVVCSAVGATARLAKPVIEQVFIGPRRPGSRDEFERRLYLIRKQTESAVRHLSLREAAFFSLTSLSSRTVVYKGLLLPCQLPRFFPDLTDRRVVSALCLVHSRYSTNTFPTWNLAQPFRYLAHNGEINTLRGNVNWMRAKEHLLRSSRFGQDREKIKPVIAPGGSDSASLDNLFEFLVLAGRSMPHAMMMLIPAAWEHNPLMEDELRAFYRYHACLMEPWDGPAAVAFTDGVRIGAVVDRNGLRPARYLVTRDKLAVMASEAGVLDFPPERIAVSGRVEPGSMLFIDTEEGRLVPSAEVKRTVASRRPYRRWLARHLVDIRDLPLPARPPADDGQTLSLMRAAGYTREELRMLLAPMAESGKEPVASMGDDTPLAVLSRRPRLLFDYLRQLFAQVTNPPIDPIRENLVMSIESFIGPRRNILTENPGHARRLHIANPILTDDDFARLRGLRSGGLRCVSLSTLFDADAEGDFLSALDRLCDRAAQAVRRDAAILILSDRGISRRRAALPALLAVGAVHQRLIREGIRAQTGLIVETAEPREVHHFAALFGYGAACVNPYLAFAAVRRLAADGTVSCGATEAVDNYIRAVTKGLLKVLSKMGISTLQGYRGAQIFEAVGLAPEVIQRCFDGTASRIGGAGFAVLAEETLLRHRAAFARPCDATPFPAGGAHQWWKDGECHRWSPEAIAFLRKAVRNNDAESYRRFARSITERADNPITLRDTLRFRQARAIPLEEVEPAERILRRFATGAMSFGSLSKSAHETIAIAMNRIGGKSNTGEGGEDPARFSPLPNGDLARSAVKQVASGRFGVTTNYLVNADEIQIKICQGAKPGEGGQLPGHKVSEVIARTRYTTPGVTLISPPPHHDIYSIEDLGQLIFDLKNVNPAARISVKLVSEIGVGTVAMGVAKAHADMVLISGADGGTGASPSDSIRHAGLPWEMGLAETHQMLTLNGLRRRVRLQVDGQICTGRDVAVAACLGADEFGFATAALVTLGCVLDRHCHLNTCPAGIACQDPRLERRFTGSPEHLVRYFRFVAEELRGIMASLGVRRLDDLIGRADLLELNRDALPWKAKGLDFSAILAVPNAAPAPTVSARRRGRANLSRVLDRRLIALAREAILRGERVEIFSRIRNTDRATGAMLSGALCRARGEEGLPPHTIVCRFRGVAGQSFGAWLARGIFFELVGMANDYVGKGLSGGVIVIRPDERVDFPAETNVIIGNTAFYGAVSGQAYIRGRAGERFCVRNSGLNAVVEGVGDHGCEYMTGGRVVILGPVGRNFAAGMSGGIAYVYDAGTLFRQLCNPEMIEIEAPGPEDARTILELLRNHARLTGSVPARRILRSFRTQLCRFVKVMPKEYRRVLEGRAASSDARTMEVADG